MPLPPGPRAPAAIQTFAWWNRSVPFFERCRARYGRRFTIRLLSTPPFVMLTDPEQIREVFTAPPEVLHPGEGALILEPLIGANSVILLDEGKHMEQRKLMLPAFHGEKMQRLSGLMAEVAEREVGSWPRNEPIELHPRLQAVTLEVILRAVFGLDPGERLDAIRARLTQQLEFGASPVSMLPQLQVALAGRGRWARFDRVRAETDEMLFELIEERRAEAGERDDVLAMLLEARHEDGLPMSPQELRDELMTLLVAGHETTASQLAWAFARLARSPEVMRRLMAEIDEGGEDYLEATIQETMRRRPVIPNAAPRLVKQPIEVGGWSYPEGVCLVPNAYLVHHDPEIYPEPYAFRPERFLEKEPGTYTWIPFGGGRRRCLGASFAMLEMRLILRAVLASSELVAPEPEHEPARRRAITISPRRRARTVILDRVPERVAVPA
jgi:cytochrome P450